jgi:hypothetical protein
LLKHFLALLIIIIVVTIIGVAIRVIIPYFINPEQVTAVRRVLSYLAYISIYLLFVNFHPFDKENLMISLKDSLKSIFSKKLLKLVYTDILTVVFVYLIYALFVYLFKFIFSNPYLLRSLVEKSGNVVVFILIALILTLNKLVIYDIKPSSLK